MSDDYISAAEGIRSLTAQIGNDQSAPVLIGIRRGIDNVARTEFKRIAKLREAGDHVAADKAFVELKAADGEFVDRIVKELPRFDELMACAIMHF
jgi:hypothetical protein